MFGWCYPTEGGASRATTRALTTAFGVWTLKEYVSNVGNRRRKV
jgi:hypothetical protein